MTLVKNTLTFLSSVALVVLPLAEAVAQPELPDYPAQDANDSERQDWLNTAVPLMLAYYDVPSAGIGFIDGGELRFVRHFGFQTWGYPANDETLYNVASITKPISAEVVLRLIERGHLALDTPLADHHIEEDVADDPRAQLLTAELVMRHRTGFPNWRYETDGVLTFIRDPDTEVGYSGEGYDWMARAAAAAAGQSFEEVARELVFDPAGMRFTGYTRNRFFPYRLAAPYKAGEAVYNVVRDEMTAADDLRTTVREFAAFLRSVFHEDHVSASLREAQATIVHPSKEHPQCGASEDGDADGREDGGDQPDFCPEREGWGLGWFVHQYEDRTILQHSGGDHGERALTIYDPASGRGVIVFTNGAQGHHVMTRVVGALFGDPRVREYFVSLSDGID